MKFSHMQMQWIPLLFLSWPGYEARDECEWVMALNVFNGAYPKDVLKTCT